MCVLLHFTFWSPWNAYTTWYMWLTTEVHRETQFFFFALHCRLSSQIYNMHSIHSSRLFFFYCKIFGMSIWIKSKNQWSPQSSNLVRVFSLFRRDSSPGPFHRLSLFIYAENPAPDGQNSSASVSPTHVNALFKCHIVIYIFVRYLNFKYRFMDTLCNSNWCFSSDTL